MALVAVAMCSGRTERPMRMGDYLEHFMFLRSLRSYISNLSSQWILPYLAHWQHFCELLKAKMRGRKGEDSLIAHFLRLPKT